MKYIFNLNKIGKKDIAVAGGKGASLGEMMQAGIPVPPGFIVSASVFDKFYGFAFPEGLAKEILTEFKKLKTKYVAVRSSATAEDSFSASWAGQLESYLNVTEKNRLESIKKCWASLYSPRAVSYRTQKGLNKKKISVAVVIQKMVQSEISGVCFTAHPITKDKNQMVIEAGYGLGEAIVGGKITPDTYIINKKTIGVGHPYIKLAKLCQKIEKLFKYPQDIEWAFAKGKFYILQSRPITTLLDKTQKQSVYEKVFSRDYSLPMLQALYKGKAYNKKPWSRKRQPFLPYIVFIREDDTVKNYYNPRGVEWIKNHIKKSIKLDKDFLNKLKNQINEKLKPIQPIYEAELPLSKEKLLKFIKNLEIAYPWTETMWWLRGNKKLKEKTAKLSAGTDAVIRKSLMKIFPEIKDFVHVLTVEEIKTEILPKLSELKSRDKGFIFTQNRLYVGRNISDIEKEYGILLERENIGENIGKIEGVVAYPGIVRGKIRRVMGHKHIHSFKEGEILVSPMTTPDFLPVAKKAIAFVTDEGGITCHAAITARELKKPCIVGTKIATQILKDGDFIEVDAKEGVVKILRRK